MLVLLLREANFKQPIHLQEVSGLGPFYHVV